MKILEYKTATADNWTSLDTDVNKLLAQGYKLYGSPYVGEKAGGGFVVAQAMIKCGLRENPTPLETFAESTIAP